MKKWISLGVGALVAFALVMGAVRAQCAGVANIIGTYSGVYVVQNGTYSFYLDVVTEDFDAGTFAGSFNGMPVTGSVGSSGFSFGVSGLSITFYASMHPDGSIGGDLLYINEHGPWSGFWSASRVPVVPPTVPAYIVGTYSGLYVVQNGTYSFYLDVVTEDVAAGTFTGTFNGMAISGSVGSTGFTFWVPGLSITFYASIHADGSIGGDLLYINEHGPWSGFWGASRNPVTPAAPDPAPPVISGVAAVAVSSTSETITWLTDVLSDGIVLYSTDTSYGWSAVGTPDVAGHTVTLTGLTPGTLYHFRVKSTTTGGSVPTGSQAVSADYSFTTLHADPDHAPVAYSEADSVASNTAATPSSLVLAVGASDADGDALTFSVVGVPAHGTLSATPGGAPNQTTYTPDVGFVGVDRFTFKASDGLLESNAATVTISVINRAPVGTSDSYTVLANSQLYVALAQGVLANDVDPEGQQLQAVLVQDTTHGVLHLGADGWFLYTPDTNFAGTDAFTYSLHDVYGANGGVVTVTISVPAAPIAMGQVASVASNTTGEPTSAALTLQATDLDSGSLTYSIITGPNHGGLTPLAGTNQTTYTPNPNFVGTDSFTFRASDGVHISNTATVTVVVTNRAPTATADAYSLARNGQLYVAPAGGLLSNDSDPEGQSLGATLASGAAHGVALVLGNGSFLYTPTTGYTGTDTFTYRAYDPHGALSAPTVVTITVY